MASDWYEVVPDPPSRHPQAEDAEVVDPTPTTPDFDKVEHWYITERISLAEVRLTARRYANLTGIRQRIHHGSKDSPIPVLYEEVMPDA